MLIYAHRGASADYPEMSRAAYLAAVEQGADGFECDLRLTRDGVLICWHDDDLMRIAGSSLVVAKSTLAELRAVTEILTFDELLTIALENRKHLALETKHPVPSRGAVERELIRTLRRFASAIDRSEIDIAIMSFSWWAIRRVQRERYAGVYLIAHRYQRWFTRSGATGPGLFLVRKDPGLAPLLTRGERRLFIWTVNDAADLEIAYRAGADVVMSDKPGEMQKVLASFRK